MRVAVIPAVDGLVAAVAARVRGPTMSGMSHAPSAELAEHGEVGTNHGKPSVAMDDQRQADRQNGRHRSMTRVMISLILETTILNRRIGTKTLQLGPRRSVRLLTET
jgi:hypothetical protein